MKIVLISCLLMAFTSPALAQKIKVKRVKGNSAVVEFSNGELTQGKTYDLIIDEYSVTAVNTAARRYLVSGSLELATNQDDEGLSRSRVYLETRSGWNWGDLEAGPVVTLDSSSGDLNNLALSVGGWLDYNMITNTSGEIFIYGGTIMGTVGMRDFSGVKRDHLYLFAGGVVKWFPTGSNVGLRFDGGLDIEQQSGGSTQNYSTTGFRLKAGLIGYF